MNYIKVGVFAEAHKLEDMAAVLADGIVSGVEINDPASYEELANKKNQYDWDYLDPSVESIKEISPCIEFYLEDTVDGLELLDQALEAVRPFTPTKVEIATVDSEDWQHQWKEYFKPVKITDRMVVKPSWEDYEPRAGELVIDLDPGMAFGTGDHPTSRLCVALLEEYMEGSTYDPLIRSQAPGPDGSDSVSGPMVLDIGAGSGILSIAAALLGAEKVLGIEIDPKAIPVALANVKKNNLENKITIVEGDLNKGIDVKADIVMANLMADLVIKLGPQVKPNLKEKGIFISSGILLEKKDPVVRSLEDAGFSIDNIKDEGEWCAISARLI